MFSRASSVALVALSALAAASCKTPTTNDSSSAAASPPTSVASTNAPAVAAGARAELGKPAPEFALPDLDGKIVKLADFKGKTVVLEWFNPGCPFVKRNHSQGPLKDMAKKQVAAGVVWLAINSSAPGKQGHGVDANREAAKKFGMEHPILIDERGNVGHAYDARSTPGMYVVDAKGTLVYRGAIDNAQDGDPPGGEKFTNYVEGVLADLAANRAVGLAASDMRPSYGCSVKYGK